MRDPRKPQLIEVIWSLRPKYYIAISVHLDLAFDDHKLSPNSEWTRLYDTSLHQVDIFLESSLRCFGIDDKDRSPPQILLLLDLLVILEPSSR